VSFVRISRAPLDKLEAYRKRMGWKALWASSYGNDFNYDFHVSFTPEEVAKKKVYYNYELRGLEADGNCPASASFIKTRTATSSIPIRPTPGATSSSTRATCCST
jgi:predicted dithiol-disulfide oxidoreductase (DUF899 family)